MKIIDNLILSTDNNEKQDTFNLTILVIVTLTCLVPFLNKAFHIDDPLFLWAARHIQSSPFDFYGFKVNWYGHEMPMFEVMQNPPLVPYYIAIVASLFGWAEVTLHIAFLVPAIAFVIGTYYLAKVFCSTPLVATLVSISTPVFLVSSTSVMCDTMMLSFWVWATFTWIQGIKNNSNINLICAAFLIALCSLTKYYGISLIPLLFIYSLVYKRKLGQWALFLLIPVLILLTYQWLAYALYGRGLILDAASYALSYPKAPQFIVKGLEGLLFTGGCFISVLFYSLLLFRARTISILASSILLFFLYYILSQRPTEFQFIFDDKLNWLFTIESCLFTMAGVVILLIAALDLWRRRDADSLLLFLCITGAFIFASFINWNVAGRSVLPMAPVIGVLVFRHIEQKKPVIHYSIIKKTSLILLVPSFLIALSLSWTDYIWANTNRSEAIEMRQQYAHDSGTLWFQGHWGFQYYMEANGGKAMDYEKTKVNVGDIVVIPSEHDIISPLNKNLYTLIKIHHVPLVSWISTWSGSIGAGFYSSIIGPLPFVVGPVPDIDYFVFLKKSHL